MITAISRLRFLSPNSQCYSFDDEKGVGALIHKDCADGGKKCIGAKGVSGETFAADIVILTVGASLAGTLTQLGRQVTTNA